MSAAKKAIRKESNRTGALNPSHTSAPSSGSLPKGKGGKSRSGKGRSTSGTRRKGGATARPAQDPIQRARDLVVEACHTLSALGYLAGIGGNVALRIDHRMAVTPSAADYFSMKPEDICILDLHSLEALSGQRSPSVESGLHAAFFQNRSDIVASVHTHQPLASAMALLDQFIPLLEQEEVDALGDRVPVVAYGPSGTGMLVRAFRKSVSPSRNGYLLRNHGVICGASTMEGAIQNVRILEKAAARYLESGIRDNAGRGRIANPALLDEVLESLRPYKSARIQAGSA
ncbi:MAG: class II aldolase/adducin family protein [Leptospiraceae bacterium]|nr:class II aldolase/adducin family protein [Leptospiraceae bacterium]